MPAVVNDEPVRDAPEDGVATGGAVVVSNEFTSAVPDKIETPSETICPVKASEPSAVAAENWAEYLPFNAELEIGAERVCW